MAKDDALTVSAVGGAVAGTSAVGAVVAASDNGDTKGRLASQRLDKWLWFARVVKTRSLAATIVTEGKVRIDGEKVDKPAHVVRLGNTITVLLRQQVRILKVNGFAPRRGSASLANALYDDLTPPKPKSEDVPTVARREPGSGRPTKLERRQMERFKTRST